MSKAIASDKGERIGRWLRFFIGGVLNTGLSYAVYLLLRTIFAYQTAYAIAYIVGIVFGYLFNARLVFNVEWSWKGFWAYPLVYFLQYIGSAVLLGLFIERLAVSEVIAPMVVSAVMVPVTYAMSRWVLSWTRHRG
ncbi:GtrA family protein [Acidovorax sp. MR-S7]|uniref:GtrA family protein n=1 Tax=Acidovorax sp. MR-S7 TaxID=1268622 RepID=UPI0003D3BEDF|nr:GtrA family protein [Acidovorax sp. MR-S7]GAD23073.1 predicted membrane protein [Acidovorax sp. MR-S7]